MLRQWGDAIGMSTVPELLVAVHAGARCLGISVITNSHARPASAVTSHEEVIETSRRVAGEFQRLMTALVAEITKEAGA